MLKLLSKLDLFRGEEKTECPACDHDFTPETKVTWYFSPHDELFLYFTESKVTSDCIVDILSLWWQNVKERFKTYLLIKLDNGPENTSRNL